MQVAVKLIKLIPVKIEDNALSLSAYRVSEERWELHDVSGEGRGVDSLLEVASEYLVRERSNEALVLVEVEGLGLKVLIGETLLSRGGTIISQKPSYLRRILVFKCDQTGKCSPKYEFSPKTQVVVYDGELVVKDLDFDFLVLECEDAQRIILPHELVLPHVRIETGKKRRGRRRKKRKASSRRKGKAS